MTGKHITTHKKIIRTVKHYVYRPKPTVPSFDKRRNEPKYDADTYNRVHSMVSNVLEYAFWIILCLVLLYANVQLNMQVNGTPR